MPIIFVHGWLPSVFKDAPISVILTGILIKTAVYGFIRFGIPLFFDSSYIIAPLMMALGVITIFYGAFIAYSKTDFRQFIAYSTLSHMGFSLIGLYSLNEIAWQGVVIQMFASFFSGAALFILAKIIYKQTNTYNLNEISGLWSVAKNTSGFTTFFVMLSLGLPGLISFVAEFLILVGVFNVSVSVAVMSSIGIILAAAYSLRIIQKLLIGEKKIVGEVKDMNNKEYVGLAFIMIIVIFMGIYTKSLTNFSQGAIKKSLEKPIEDYRDIKYKNSISVETKFLK